MLSKTSLLSPSTSSLAHDKRHILSQLPADSKVIAVAAARVYHAPFGAQHDSWAYSGLRGLMVFGRERITVRGDRKFGTGPGTSFEQKYWFRLIDMSSGKGVVWMHQITENFEYCLDKPFFHIFPGKTRMFGFCFEEDAEAGKFYKKVTGRLPAAGTRHRTPPCPRCPPTTRRFKKPLPPLPPKRLSPSMISSPAAGTFVHVSHVGFNDQGHIELSDNVEPGWTMMLTELHGHGVTEKVVKNDIDFVEGFWAGVKAVQAGNAPHEEQEQEHGASSPSPSNLGRREGRAADSVCSPRPSAGEKRRRVHRKPVERV
ncbi:hypothetical protein B0H21DRAFT_698985 [Amylocystis lapponica]|nr:hypothetical protein B0H21DRAFT_698985 [Amylocystis lapponica]